MNTFSNAMKNTVANKMTTTTNGMPARVSTTSKVLDLFGAIGNARKIDLSGLFNASYAENSDLTLRMLMWVRDITEGSGERSTFRKLLRNLEVSNPAEAAKFMEKVPVIGRWDDLFAYEDPINRRAALEFFAEALRNGNMLAAKWAPREKSAKSKWASELRATLGLTPKQYRKLLVENTQVVETQMCAKQWYQINFSHVPSMASARYQKAFGKNAADRYSEYLRELQKPQDQRDQKVKINAKALFPYDVLNSVLNGNPAIADEQWKALPNFIGDAKIFPMVDVSGSMGSFGVGDASSPINAAVSLGLYVADKNTGPFKDLFLTFSNKPEILHLKGSLSQKISQMTKSHWETNTNLEAAFAKILEVAVVNKVNQEDMPDALVIFSDMQFDAAVGHNGNRAIDMARQKYEQAGYNIPKIIFWNLNGYFASQNVPVKFDEHNTAHVSGYSPALMKSVLSNDLEEFTPYNVMISTLMKSRYDIE